MTKFYRTSKHSDMKDLIRKFEEYENAQVRVRAQDYLDYEETELAGHHQFDARDARIINEAKTGPEKKKCVFLVAFGLVCLQVAVLTRPPKTYGHAGGHGMYIAQ